MGSGAGGYDYSSQFGGFPGNQYLSAPTAQLGLQVGQSAITAGQDFMQANMSRYGVSSSALRHYFNVTNNYVLKKLLIVLFPWRHAPWTRGMMRDGQGQVESFLDPREDVNAPDFYIPIMAFVTYTLLNSLIAGVRGAFQADLLGETAGWAMASLLIENGLIKFGCYLLNIPSTFFLDLVAYSGYKYVGITLTNLVGLLGLGRMVYWTVFLYTALACSFFELRSLRSAILQGTEDGVGRAGKARRVYFLAGISIAQVFWMYLMLR